MRVRPLAPLVLLLGLASFGCAPPDGGSGSEPEREAPAPESAPAAGAPGGGAAAAAPGRRAETAPGAAEHVPGEGLPVVVFLGTSLTAGYGLASEEDTYARRLTELADAEGVPFRAINAGVSGDTSAGGLRRLDWVLRAPLDVLVVELGANDGLRGLDAEQLRENLVEIVRRVRARRPDASVILVSMEAPPNLGRTYTARFRAVYAEVAAAEGTLLAPFLLDGVAGVPALNQNDGIHPTAEGHELMAKNLWPTLRAALLAVEAVR